MPVYNFEFVDGKVTPAGSVELPGIVEAEAEARRALYEMHPEKYGELSVHVTDEVGKLLLKVSVNMTVERHA